MKTNKIFVMLIFMYFNLTFSQTTAKSTPQLANQFIVEVFGASIAKDSQHYKNLEKLLRERVVFVQEPMQENEKFPKISQMQLFNKYNSNLERDLVFEQASFNVLKYDLIFFSPYTKVYRFDNSDWLIQINP